MGPPTFKAPPSALTLLWSLSALLDEIPETRSSARDAPGHFTAAATGLAFRCGPESRLLSSRTHGRSEVPVCHRPSGTLTS